MTSPSKALAAGLASILAWSFDLFDLFLILYIAPTIGPLFFPSSSPTLSLAAVYASFAVTLLMRPVGSMIFGSYADRRGRKAAMIFAVFGVGVATASLGILPTIAQAGIGAPILFIIVRLIQGIFVGGVVASTHTLGTETVAPQWRGMLSGLIGGGGAAAGGLLASIVFLLVSWAFPGPLFGEWGWRVMFFTGIIGALLSFVVFRAVEESPLWTQLEERPHAAPTKSPLVTVFAENRPQFLTSLLIVAGAGTQYYLTSGFLPTFLAKINAVPKPVAGQILIGASLVIFLSAPLAGHISEIIGRKKTFIGIGIINLVSLPLLYNALAHVGANEVGLVTLYALALSFLGNAGYAPVLVFLNERFKTAVRSTGTGVSWNIGFAIGGIMPTFVAASSKTVAALPRSLEIFLVGAMVCYLFGAFVSPETRGRFES